MLDKNKHLSEPFMFKGEKDVAGLLVHGLTASPAETRRLGKYLNDKLNVTTVGIRLKGHGTTPEDLKDVKMEEWLTQVKDEYTRLCDQYSRCFLVGVSLGSLLVTFTSARSDLPKKPCSVIAISPPWRMASRTLFLVKWLRHFIKYLKKSPGIEKYYLDNDLWSYTVYPLNATYQLLRLIKTTKKIIKKVDVPIQVHQGLLDDLLKPDSGRTFHDLIPAQIKEFHEYPNSGHILTVEPDAEEMFNNIKLFLQDNCNV